MRFRRWLFVLLPLLLAGVAVGASLATVKTFYGDSATDHFGFAVAGAGDVNADGYDDVIAGSMIGEMARVFSGKDNKTLYTLKGTGTNGAYMFGSAVAGAGDANKDGYDDFLIGEQSHGSSTQGRAHLYSGKDGKLIRSYTGSAAGNFLGCSVDGVGDVNADGYDDAIVGAKGVTTNGTYSGAAYVFSGKDGKTLFSYLGDDRDNQLGDSVAGVGDVDDDGTPDFAAGMPGAYAVRIWSGKDGKLIRTVKGATGDGFGCSVDGAGDVNGDGYDDLIVGERSYSSNRGRGVLISGKDGTELTWISGIATGANAGESVSGVGDIDGDGYPEVVIGIPDENSDGKTGNGAIRIYSFYTRSTLYLSYGDSSGDAFGWSVAGIGDVNGDGIPDIAVGAYRDDNNGNDSGSVRILAMDGPLGTISIDDGATGTTSTSVTLSLTWSGTSAAVEEIRFRNQGDSWTAWETVSSKRSWTLTTGEGEKRVEAQFKDEDGDTSGAIGATIHLDFTAPTGTLSIENGAVYTGSTDVLLNPNWVEAGSGVVEVRARNQGGTWSNWLTAGDSIPFTIPSGDGEKTVELQGRDGAGNTSDTISDTILLDQTPPSATVLVNDGAEATKQVGVTVSLSATDTGSGVMDYQVRNGGSPTWEPWTAFAGEATFSWDLATGYLEPDVEVVVRDAVGNLTAVISDSIMLDTRPPEIWSLSFNGGRPYVHPFEDLVLSINAGDLPAGSSSGMAAFRLSYDEGTSWSDWLPLTAGGDVAVPRPAGPGVLTARVMVRDRAENLSDTATAETYLMAADPKAPGTGFSLSGALSYASEADGVAIDLARGDLVTVTVKGKPIIRKTNLILALDLVGPAGDRVVIGRYPKDGKKPAISKFAVPETGRYLIVVRRDTDSTATGGTYKLKASVKQAKENKKPAGDLAGTVLTFDAVAGSTLKATLSVPGLTAADVTIVGPKGSVLFAAKESKRGLKILTVTLDAGTGTYELRFAAAVTGSYKLGVKLPKKAKGTITE